MNREELLRRYAAGERDFSGVDLIRANLSDIRVPHIILRDANLSYVKMDLSDLNFADLSGANLSGANLEDTTFEGANLSGANLKNALFFQSYLGKVNFSHADLSGAVLTECSLKNANLSHANLRKVRELSMSSVKRAICKNTIMPDGSIRTDIPSN